MNVSREDVIRAIDKELYGNNSCSDNIKIARERLKEIEEKGSINGEWIIYTFRPVVGRFIVIVKRFLRKLLHGYIPRIVEEENKRASAQNSVLRIMIDAVEELNNQVEKLYKEQAELKAILANIREENDQNIGEIKDNLLKQKSEINDLAEIAHKDDLDNQALAAFPYDLFEDRFRGTVEDIKERQRIYLKYFKGRDFVLDCGCGRGEFLSLLSSEGVPAKGIDMSNDMVSRCKGLGLNVEKADIFSYLEKLKDGVLDGVFCCQVVEHLTSGQLIRFIDLLSKKVRIGAPVVIETINPGTLPAGANGFYMDFTHVRPINSATLSFLLETKGFPLQEKLFIHRDVAHALPQLNIQGMDTFNEKLDGVNDLLFGPWDYAIVAYRK
jgi:O-antigen chain-terminating methyltransferase